ncbi:MAG: hypothetical protein FJ202_13505 [Gemmatimonadetes bacterium]|nr:hypothetical protein [Gemmatimonadota bacterium]
MAVAGIASAAEPARMERVVVSADGRGFALADSGRPFVPWGFNYDHDDAGRLIEDYWEREWPRVEEDFREMKELGANVVRIHLQFAKFMDTATKPNAAALAQLSKLLALAERTGLRLDLTGLGCYHKQDVPAWYDALDEKSRWAAQATFWEAVAVTCKDSPAVFCHDLMNEPVVAGGRRKPGEWLGGAFAGKHFVQFITLDAAGRETHAVAREWTRQLVAAIRKHDRRALVTVGLVDWSLDRPGLRSGFVPDKIAPELDFICVHLYPKRGSLTKDMETLRGFAVGKPVVIEETFPLHAGMADFGAFVKESRGVASGWVGFYWGKTLAECRKSRDFKDALMVAWLEFFQREAEPMTKPR